MRRIFPYPILTLALTLMWLLLQQSVGLGHVLLGFVVAWSASQAWRACSRTSRSSAGPAWC